MQPYGDRRRRTYSLSLTATFQPGFRDWKCIVPSEDRIRQVVG
jgi:hypothetical protein